MSRTFRKLWGVVCALAFSSPAFADLTGVDQADDLCAPDTDPCLITQRVATVDGATLDFGFRTIEVSGDGGFDIGSGHLTIKCGSFLGTTGRDDVLVDGRDPDMGGDFDVDARGSCADAPAQPCYEDADCTTGACVGVGRVELAGRIEMHGREGGSVGVHAKGDVQISEPIDLSGGIDGAGGITVIAASGSFTLDAPIFAPSPGFGAFMYLTTEPRVTDSRSPEARAAGPSSRGMVINAPIIANAGEEGGEVYLISAAELKLNASVYCNGHGVYDAGGYGGYITVIASGGDLELAPKVRLFADASTQAQDSGDGGLIEVRADGGNLVVPSGVKARARGGGTYAYGGQVYFSAAGDATVDARVDVSSRGVESSGGDVTLEVDRNLTVGPQFRARARGGEDGGTVYIFAADATVEGRFSLLVGRGKTGNFFAEANNLSLGARIDLNGNASAFHDPVEIEACNVTLTDTARIESRVPSDANSIQVSGQLTVNSGASLTADPDGTTRFIYRDSAQPPVILGTVTPAPALELDETLAPCP